MLSQTLSVPKLRTPRTGVCEKALYNEVDKAARVRAVPTREAHWLLEATRCPKKNTVEWLDGGH